MSESRIIVLAPQTAPELSPPDLITCAAQAGYSHVGVRVVTGAARPDSPMAPGQPLLRETAERLRQEGVGLHEAEVVRLDAQTQVDDFRPALEAAAWLGATRMVAVSDDPEPARAADYFARLCELADAHGLTVDIEPIPYYVTRDIAAAEALIARSGSRNGGIVPDPLHLFRSGDGVEGLRRITPGLLHLAQLCDAPAAIPDNHEEMMRQARTARLDPGEGGLDLLGYLRALPEGLPLSLEVPKTELAASVPAVVRARNALEGTRRLLAQL